MTPLDSSWFSVPSRAGSASAVTGVSAVTGPPAWQPTLVSPQPVFGLVLQGGPVMGSRIRDVRLANELASRGWRVHVWWAMDRPRRSNLHKDITESWLFSCVRYSHPFRWSLPYGIKDLVGRIGNRLLSDRRRFDDSQRHPWFVRMFVEGYVRQLCEGVGKDVRMVRRFARQIERTGVTHVLPMLSILSPWVFEARRLVRRPVRCLVTFQGYEVCANYARDCHCEARFYERLRNVAMQSDWPAVAVSEYYRRRVMDELGVPASAVRGIPPGVPAPDAIDRGEALKTVSAALDAFRPDLPLVTYFGRRDAEKGVDLLLYAASILRKRGVDLQLAVCGPTLHGNHYAEACREIAQNLRCPVLWSGYVPRELRTALYAASRIVVYPSIYHEAFGMVPVEAMSYGTPAVVPDTGGLVEAIEADGHTGGLLFRSWDSGDLAEQIGRLLTDADLWRRLSEAGPRVAAFYSVRNMTDRILAHMGLPPGPETR